MTNAELLAKIKAEIERRIKLYSITNEKEQWIVNTYWSVLSFLSTIESEKHVPTDLDQAAEISFDEAYALTGDYTNFLAKGLTENQSRPIGPHWFCEYAKKRFIEGAKWQEEKDERIYRDFFNERNQGDASFRDLLAYKEGHCDGMTEQKEQMLKEAVEISYKGGTARINGEEKPFESGKVRVIILPKED